MNEKELPDFMDDVRSVLTALAKKRHTGDGLVYCAQELLARWNTEAHKRLSLDRDAWRLIDTFAAPVGMDLASCQEAWGTEGEAKYYARMLLFSSELLNAAPQVAGSASPGTDENLGATPTSHPSAANPAVAAPSDEAPCDMSLDRLLGRIDICVHELAKRACTSTTVHKEKT